MGKFYVIQKKHQEVRIFCEIFFGYPHKEWDMSEIFMNRIRRPQTKDDIDAETYK